jgi:hypothetical protein
MKTIIFTYEEIRNRKEFGDPSTVSGTYTYNKENDVWVIEVDSVEFLLTSETFTAKSKEEIPSLIKNRYGIDVEL